jgi:hypothetical protein
MAFEPDGESLFRGQTNWKLCFFLFFAECGEIVFRGHKGSSRSDQAQDKSSA